MALSADKDRPRTAAGYASITEWLELRFTFGNPILGAAKRHSVGAIMKWIDVLTAPPRHATLSDGRNGAAGVG